MKVCLLLLAAVIGSAHSDDIVISLEPLLDVPDKDFAGFYFKPYQPEASSSCFEICPCKSNNEQRNLTDCFCGSENVCGGEFDLDLEGSGEMKFEWSASSDNSKFITIEGTGDTRIEFQATFDCGSHDGEYMYQEIEGATITPNFEFVTEDGFDDPDGATQSYQYNAGASFLDLGMCDGCGDCEIYTRLQFDPKGGKLALNFKAISYTFSYDDSNVVPGTNEYYWGTDKYCWMRDSRNRKDRKQRSTDNTYEIKVLPNVSTTTSASGNSGATVQPMVWLSAFGLFVYQLL